MVARSCFALLLVLLACAACGAHDVAASCGDDDECETGLCYTESEPGYCTAECGDEGSTDECPVDTVCKRIEGGPARCLLICEVNEECPPNSDCNNVSDSDFRACEPVR